MTTISDLFKTNGNAQNSNASAPAAQGGARINPKTGQPYEKAKVWINFGLPVEVPNAEGELVKKVVNLPVGIPFSNVEPIQLTGNNTPEWIEEVAMRNLLLKALQQATSIENLPPGQTIVLDLPWVISARRVAEDTVPNVGESAGVAALAKMLGLSLDKAA